MSWWPLVPGVSETVRLRGRRHLCRYGNSVSGGTDLPRTGADIGRMVGAGVALDCRWVGVVPWAPRSAGHHLKPAPSGRVPTLRQGR